MSLLPSEFEQVFFMKVVGNCLFLPPTKLYVIWPSKTPYMGKILSSVWAGLQDRFWLLFCGQTLDLKMADLGLPLFMNYSNLYKRDKEPKFYSWREWEGPAKHKFSIQLKITKIQTIHGRKFIQHIYLLRSYAISIHHHQPLLRIIQFISFNYFSPH